MALDLLGQKTLIDKKAVMGILMLSESTVKKKTASGEIPSVKMGRSVRYRQEDIYRYIADHTRQSEAFNG